MTCRMTECLAKENERLTASLDFAVSVIESYQRDIHWKCLDREGFCQGSIYLDALDNIERLRTGRQLAGRLRDTDG